MVHNCARAIVCGLIVRLLIINPNATERMTDSAVAVARTAMPEAEIIGWTNLDGPPAIQGPEDGAAAVVGLLSMAPSAQKIGADAIVIACFDDTGLADLREAVDCPVFGIGQTAFHMAALLGKRFEVMTSLEVSVPIIADNIANAGFVSLCAGVYASGLAVLEIEAGGPEVEDRLVDHMRQASGRGSTVVLLGCCAMAPLRAQLTARTGLIVIDGIEASVNLAAATHHWRQL